MTKDFEQEMLECLPKLRAVAIMMTRDRANAEDLIQDTLVQAIAAQDSYTLGTNFAGWAYRIMRNRHISLIRRRRFITVPLEDPAALAVGRAGDQESRIAQLELAHALKAMPLAQREAVLLVGAMGMDYDEVARVLGCAVGTVKSRVSRGRESLRRQLLDDETNVAKKSKVAKHGADVGVLAERNEREIGFGSWWSSTEAVA